MAQRVLVSAVTNQLFKPFYYSSSFMKPRYSLSIRTGYFKADFMNNGFFKNLHCFLDAIAYLIRGMSIEFEGWRQHSSLIFLILLFTKPIIEVSGWLYWTKTHFTHIVNQLFSRVSPPSFTLYVCCTEWSMCIRNHS